MGDFLATSAGLFFGWMLTIAIVKGFLAAKDSLLGGTSTPSPDRDSIQHSPQIQQLSPDSPGARYTDNLRIDAEAVACISGNYWICACGTNNLNSVMNSEQKCERCSRIKKDTLNKYGGDQYRIRHYSAQNEAHPLADSPQGWLTNKAGKDAETFACISGDYWKCVCGTNNLNSVMNSEQRCQKCSRVKRDTLNKFTEDQYLIRP